MDTLTRKDESIVPHLVPIPTCTSLCDHGRPHARNQFCGKGKCHMGETECIEENKEKELELYFESQGIPLAGALAQAVIKIMEVI